MANHLYLFRSVTATAMFTFSSMAAAAPIYVAKTGDVGLQFVASDALYHSTIGLSGGPSAIFDDHSSHTGDTYYLGSFAAGTVLDFTLDVLNTGNTFFSDDALSNADGVTHAQLSSAGDRVTVGFEDLYGGGDRDYNDAVFSISNASLAPVAAVPEPASWAMMIFGIGGVGGLLRRGRKAAQIAGALGGLKFA